jgi:cytochrome c peroxidase
MNRFIALTACLLAALAVGGCMTPPPDLDLSLRRPTEQGKYVVTLQPPAVPPAINQIHAWRVSVASPAGTPVKAASIAVDGGMPQHGHGLPTKPLVQQEVADGTYLLEGMKFSMIGWWQIKLALQTAEGADKVTFNVVVNNDGTPARKSSAEQWSAEEVRTIASMGITSVTPAPADRSNAVEQLPAAVALGKRLFNDTRFSSNGAVSCASCHAPDKQFQDGLPVGRGVGIGSRRSMPIVGAGHSPWMFWDGRKDSLWSQALGPLEDSVEHGGNRTRFAHVLATHYLTEYEALFGTLPALAGLPPDAGPNGNAAEKSAWNALPGDRRTDVSRMFANMGKVIAAYEKTLAYGAAPFDRYADAVAAKDPAARDMLDAQQVNGLRLFIGKGQCVTCHNGPLLTDQHFHNTGVPPRDSQRPDRGRAAALAKVRQDEFNCLGPFSDARAGGCQELAYMVTDPAGLEAAFKTPSLRNVALRPPYMHAGQFATLEEVVAHYAKSPAAVLGHSELAHGEGAHRERQPIRLSQREISDVAAFLGTLTGPIVERARL